MVYLFFLAHLVADFALQPLWLVRRKRRWDGLGIHVGLVLFCMLALLLVEPMTRALWPAMILISGVHLFADWWKVNQADKLFRPPLVPFVLDQVIHAATIALVLGLFLPQTQIWSPAASILAWPAIYVSAYLVAALAVPIALIVFFDPTFTHAAHAAQARLRSLVVALVVLSLALWAGPLALPVTLIGLALATRRAASPHPLDGSQGLLAVSIVAALSGAVLSLI